MVIEKKNGLNPFYRETQEISEIKEISWKEYYLVGLLDASTGNHHNTNLN